jgi:hypothetical protein
MDGGGLPGSQLPSHRLIHAGRSDRPS